MGFAVALALGCASANNSSNFIGGLQSDTSGSNAAQVSDSSQSFGSGSTSPSSDQSTQATNSQSVLTASLAGAALTGAGILVWSFVPSVRPMTAQVMTTRRYHQVKVAAMRYFRGQADQLLQDLALGAGPTVDDLAGAAGVRAENVARFGRLLREHRAELVSMLEPERLTEDGAAAALRRIGEIASEDPALREDGERYLASAPPP